MFNKLTDLSYKRTAVQAIGFYIAYFIFTLLLAGLVGGIGGVLVGSKNSFEFGLRAGNVIAILVSLAISFLILQQKQLMGNFTLLALAVFSGILALFGGGLLGLIIPSYLSTK